MFLMYRDRLGFKTQLFLSAQLPWPGQHAGKRSSRVTRRVKFSFPRFLRCLCHVTSYSLYPAFRPFLNARPCQGKFTPRSSSPSAGCLGRLSGNQQPHVPAFGGRRCRASATAPITERLWRSRAMSGGASVPSAPRATASARALKQLLQPKTKYDVQ
jgi:hypothetical protein